MPYRHRLQASRFELKYLIDERCARNIRDFARAFLELDEHALLDQPNCAYHISSLYLDTPDLRLYGQTMSGLKNRFKLRIRFYDDRAESPAFLEIKSRQTDVVHKERCAVTREGVGRLLRHETLDASRVVAENGNGREESALGHFRQLMHSIGAVPRLYVSYLREAYVSPNSDQTRLTFDRHLTASRFDPTVGLAMPSAARDSILDRIVLELKFTDRFPVWMRELVQTFNLERRSVAKYCRCVDAMGYQTDRWRVAQPEVAR